MRIPKNESERLAWTIEAANRLAEAAEKVYKELPPDRNDHCLKLFCNQYKNLVRKITAQQRPHND